MPPRPSPELKAFREPQVSAGASQKAMTAETWRYMDSGPLPGSGNMALDQALLEAHARGDTPPTLRVYSWRPPAVSLGRFQRSESSVDLHACQVLGVDVVRRPTGGRAILHTTEEVTFSLVVSTARLGTTGVMDSYRSLAAGILAALRSLGLEARLAERSSPSSSRIAATDPACFAVKARCDLVVGSAKLVGSAQVHSSGAVLQQNSLPLHLRPEDWRQVFLRSPDPPGATGLSAAAGREVSYQEVAAALRAGFAAAFGVSFEDAGPSDWEATRARFLARKVSVLG